jgi:hypothetical protein
MTQTAAGTSSTQIRRHLFRTDCADRPARELDQNRPGKGMVPDHSLPRAAAGLLRQDVKTRKLFFKRNAPPAKWTTESIQYMIDPINEKKTEE